MENAEENVQNHSLGIGPDKIKKAEEEKQIEGLLKLVEEKGIDHAEKVAKKLNDHYIMSRFYEEAAKIEKLKAKAEIEKEKDEQV